MLPLDVTQNWMERQVTCGDFLYNDSHQTEFPRGIMYGRNIETGNPLNWWSSNLGGRTIRGMDHDTTRHQYG